jgi:hypothetical protein
MVTLSIVSGFVAAAGADVVGGDAVADGDVVRVDKDVLDEQAQNALAVFDGGGVGVVVQGGQECFDGGGEGEVVLSVGVLGVEGVDLVAEVGFSGA